MKTCLATPPFLLGAALVFWGWQTGLWWAGLAMAVAVEGARWTTFRWEFSEKELRNLWDFTTVLLAAVALFLFASNEGADAVSGLFRDTSPASQYRLVRQGAETALQWFRWSPLVFLLVMLAQAYGTRDKIPFSVFSILLRRRRARQAPGQLEPEPGINVSYPYLAICLFGACMVVRPGPVFFAGFVVLLGWGLWPGRSKRYSPAAWAGMFMAAAALGFGTGLVYQQFSGWANAYGANWLAQFFIGSANPRESRTALGMIGRVQLSGRIILRVQPRSGVVPDLLREASYHLFSSPNWAGAGRLKDFDNVGETTNQASWDLAPGQKPDGVVTIAQYLTGRGEDARRGLLALPQGAIRLEHLPAFLMSTNRLGVVRVDEGPGLVIYDASYRAGSTMDAPPDKDDLLVPRNEQGVLSNIVTELRLSGKPASDLLRAVGDFFSRDFRYSAWLPAAYRGGTNLTPVGFFLTRDRKGHCEYFATAAVLLLRQAGVPARYATGYAVCERSGREYVVRERHAHAWALVWQDGRWRDFDVTPPSWIEVEEERASWLEWARDAGSRLWFEFSKFRWGQGNVRRYLFWILVPLLAFLLGRMLLGGQWKRLRHKSAARGAGEKWPGLDSEYYRLETALGRAVSPRRPDETAREWLDRLRGQPVYDALGESPRGVLHLHYRLRFDPRGLDEAGRASLRTAVDDCLKKLSSASV
jgi:protein-glutamine gamma-glutamyltransferase